MNSLKNIDLSVNIKESNIEGEGLFAEKDFYLNDIIISIIEENENGLFVSKYATKINHSKEANSIGFVNGANIFLKATTFIKSGEEITVDYDNQNLLINQFKDSNTGKKSFFGNINEYAENGKWYSDKSKWLGTDNCGLESLKKICGQFKKTSFATLISLAKDNGITLVPYKVNKDILHRIPLPAIVHSDNHFDIIKEKKEFNIEKKYTGNVLLLHYIDELQPIIYGLGEIKGEEPISATAIISLITATLATGGTIAGIASKQTTQCGKECRAKCRGKKGFLGFGEKKGCKKDCKTKCIESIADVKLRELRMTEEAEAAKEKRLKIVIFGAIGLIIIAGLFFIAYKKL